MPSINLDNLERYDSKARNEAEEEYMPKDSGNWQKTEEAGAVSFYPVGGSPLEGKVKFSFKETPPASGDKGPENPSTITGVSSVKVTRCGKNLLVYPYYDNSFSDSTLTSILLEDGSLKITKTTSTNNRYYTFISSGLTLVAGSTITMNLAKISGTNMATGIGFQLVDAKANTSLGIWSVLDNPLTYTLNRDVNLKVRLYLDRNFVATDFVIKPQIEIGSVASTYEKGAGVSTTLPLGSTFYGGEIDLATGLMTVTHYCWVWHNMNFGNPESYNSETGYAHFNRFSRPNNMIAYTNMPNSADVNGFYSCSHFPTVSKSSYTDISNGNISYPNLWFTPGGDQMRVVAPFSTKNDFNDWIDAQYDAGTPVTLVYRLNNPLTVQLSPLALSALAQTDKCTPRLNTVYTDADAIQIGYTKSPQRTEQEITQALLEIESNGSD